MIKTANRPKENLQVQMVFPTSQSKVHLETISKATTLVLAFSLDFGWPAVNNVNQDLKELYAQLNQAHDLFDEYIEDLDSDSD